ncbi:MAG: FtsX-like permease family protein [Planctomycetota bacterium]
MYQALLTRRYLFSKIMPLLASLAVMLSVAMELITWSVMGGFLDTLISTGRNVIGDVNITWPQVGFAHYDELIERLEEDDRVVSATPVTETYGLINLPGGFVKTVSIRGVDPEGYDRVTGWFGGHYWTPIEEPLRLDKDREDPRLDEELRPAFERLRSFGRRLEFDTVEDGAVRPRAAVVLGTEVYPKGAYRQRAGFVSTDIAEYLIGEDATIQVLPTDQRGGAIGPAARTLVIANEAQSGVYEIDSSVVYVPLAALQAMLKMDEAEVVAGPGKLVVDENGEPVGFAAPDTVDVSPARVTSVLVRGADGVDPKELKLACEQSYAAFSDERAGDVPRATSIIINTWRDQNRTLIAAVEKETALVLFIFGIVSLTSIFLVLAIFWSMVSEKTRDVGILRALGASKTGVAWLWVRYGLAIGTAGSLFGVLLAYAVISNINEIHDFLGEAFGLVIWDPSVYYFSTIPSDLDPVKAAIIAAAGLLSSTVGALVPAWRAANMDPVQALRFE